MTELEIEWIDRNNKAHLKFYHVEPCPFCGSCRVEFSNNYLVCVECEARGGYAENSHAGFLEAAHNWNRISEEVY